MIFVNAFILGGIICLVGQIMIDVFKLLPVKVACLFVLIGSLLRIGDLYQYLINFGGAGALLPISSFGYTMANASLEYGLKEGILGVLKGPLTATSIGIGFAIICAIVEGVLFKPKG